MKKLFMAFMAVAAISLIGCSKDKNVPDAAGDDQKQDEQKKDTTVTPPAADTDAVPEGYVRIMIQVPDNEECHGIYMKGNINGSDWSGANTYIGEEGGQTPVAEAIRFKRVENSDFFQADFKLGSNGLEGAVCQQYDDDGSWEGKSKGVKLIADKTTLEGADKLDLPQFHIEAGAKPGVLALKIGGWEKSACIQANEAGQAIFTMKSLKALPEGTEVGITGEGLNDLPNWDHKHPIVMQKNGDVYKAIANVKANCVYKYVIKFADEAAWKDRHGHILAGGDKGNISMPLSLQPVDEVEDWIDFDKHYLPEPFVKADHKFGLIGTWDQWAADKYSFEYVEDEEDYLVAEVANVEVAAATEFKIRENSEWTYSYGWSDVEILGDDANFEDAKGNIKAKEAATYDKVVLKFKWNGDEIEEMSLDFQKK